MGIQAGRGSQTNPGSSKLREPRVVRMLANDHSHSVGTTSAGPQLTVFYVLVCGVRAGDGN